MKDSILEQLEKEITQTEARLASLHAARSALLNLPASKPRPAAAIAGDPDRERAPAGHLREAMLAALAGSKGMTKMEMAKQLKARKYEYSLRPAHIARNLSAMMAEGKVKASKKGLSNLYFLPK